MDLLNTICAVALDSPGNAKGLLDGMIRAQSGGSLDDRMFLVDDSGHLGIAASGRFSADSFYHDPGGRLAVALSGTIVNIGKFGEIAKGSGAAPPRGDAAAVAALFLRFGEDFVEKLHGGFNIAVWDGRNDRILVYRDQAGWLPLFYSAGHNGIRAAASRVEALVKPGIASPALDHEAIYHFLYDKAFAASKTPFADVKGLLPGHRLALNRSGAAVEPYYTMRIRKAPMDEQEAIDGAESLLIEVLEESISHVDRIGLLLSGGVDSLLLLGVVRSISDKPVHTYSIFLDSKGTDEEYTRKASDHFGTVHTEISLDKNTVDSHLMDLTLAYPTPAVGAWHIYLGTLAAGRDGVTSVMSGFGGELVFGIPDDHRFIGGIHRFLRVLDPRTAGGRGVLSLAGRSADLFSRLYPKARIVRQYADARLGRQRWLGSRLTEKEIDAFLSFDTSGFRRVNERYIEDQVESGAGDITDMLLYSRMKNFEGNKVLGKCDELSRRNGARLFHPFLDRRMIEFGFSIPNRIKYRKGQFRHLEVSLAGRYHDFQRRKSAFIAPFEKWLRSDPPVEAKRAFDPSNSSARRIFDPAALETVWDEFLREESDLAWADIFSIISLSVWLDNAVPDERRPHAGKERPQ